MQKGLVWAPARIPGVHLLSLSAKDPTIMKLSHLIVAVAVVCSLSWEAVADTSQLRVRALRQARKAARMAPSAEVSAMKNTTFDGIWGGRLFFNSRSTCANRLNSFDFRHLLLTKGGSGYLSTNHDRDFTGRSRDKGRRWEFVKGASVGGRRAAIAVVYHSLSRNGNSAGAGYGLSIEGVCDAIYAGNAIRLAR